jgi:DNA repair exonuclease SbcCD ATPase subunit
MNINDYNQIKRIVASSPKITSEDVVNMENLMKTYYDKRTSICKTCDAQIRFSFQLFKNWFNTLEEPVEVVEEAKGILEKEKKEEDKFARAKREVEEFSEKRNCQVCGKEIDKSKNKFCSKECRYKK